MTESWIMHINISKHDRNIKKGYSVEDWTLQFQKFHFTANKQTNEFGREIL